MKRTAFVATLTHSIRLSPDQLTIGTFRLQTAWFKWGLERVGLMQGGAQQRYSAKAVFLLLVSMMVLTPLGPMAGLFASDVEAAVGTRHVYEFSDGSVEHIALYQGANPDMERAYRCPRAPWSRT